MEVFVLRHGEAVNRPSISTSDSKRQLTTRGKNELEEISEALKVLDIEFDYIFTSPLIRSKQTAEIIFKKIKSKNKIAELQDLKPEGNRLEFYNKLTTLKQDSRILIVGHEPYLSSLIGEVISQNKCKIDLKKGGLARIKIISLIPKVNGELKWLLTPRHLRKMI